MTRPRTRFAAIVVVTVLLVLLQAACGEQVTNVFSNVTAPPGATQSP